MVCHHPWSLLLIEVMSYLGRMFMVSSVRYAQYLAPFSVVLVGVVMVFILTVTTGGNVDDHSVWWRSHTMWGTSGCVMFSMLSGRHVSTTSDPTGERDVWWLMLGGGWCVQVGRLWCKGGTSVIRLHAWMCQLETSVRYLTLRWIPWVSEESGGGKILRRGCPLPCITLEHVVYYYMVIVM